MSIDHLPNTNGEATQNILKDAHQSQSDNQAFVLQKKGQFSYETRLMPALSSDNHVIVTITATGLCGSDVHYWRHGEIGNFKVRQPLILGHESAGIVKECGRNVTSLRPGDRVALEPGIPCRVCTFCRGGRYNLCADVQFAATPPHDGTLAKYYSVPEDFCHILPSHVSLEEGALVEPLSVAVHCVKLANITFGTSLLVLGAGPIGVLCCAVARAFGAVDITAVDIIEDRLNFARQYAATHTYRMSKGSAAEHASQILVHTNVNGGFDVVIDATGVETCISTGLHALKRGGTFIQAGLGASSITFPISEVCSKEASFRGSFRYGPGDYATAVRLLAERRVSVKELITHRYQFTEAEQAFENVVSHHGIKSIIYGPDVVHEPEVSL